MSEALSKNEWRLRDGWRAVEAGEVIRYGDVSRCLGVWTEAWTAVGATCPLNFTWFRRTRPDAELPPVEPVPTAAATAESSDDAPVAGESDWPWPGYRVKDGWRRLAVGETPVEGSVFANPREYPPMLWWKAGLGCEITDIHYPHFHRTRRDADLPPVEPIPTQSGDVHDAWLQKLSASSTVDPAADAKSVEQILAEDYVRPVMQHVEQLERFAAMAVRDRDLLAEKLKDAVKQVEDVSASLQSAVAERERLREEASQRTADNRRLMGEVQGLNVERDKLRQRVETLTADCEGLSMEKARLENDLHRMQQTPAAKATPDRNWLADLRPCFVDRRESGPVAGRLHKWITDAGIASGIVELEDGKVVSVDVACITFQEPAKP